MSQSSVMEAPRTGVTAPTGRNLLSAWVCRLQGWLIRRQGWQDLNLLDDRLLQDVGFSREDPSPEGRRALLRTTRRHARTGRFDRRASRPSGS